MHTVVRACRESRSVPFLFMRLLCLFAALSISQVRLHNPIFDNCPGLQKVITFARSASIQPVSVAYRSRIARIYAQSIFIVV